MSESTQSIVDQSLAALMERVVSSVDTTTEFLSAQLPDVIVQLLTFYSIWHGIFAFLLVAPALYHVIWMRFYFKVQRDYKHGRRNARPTTDGEDLRAVFGSFAAVILLFVFTLQLKSFIMVMVAPKLYLIEYMRGLT